MFLPALPCRLFIRCAVHAMPLVCAPRLCVRPCPFAPACPMRAARPLSRPVLPYHLVYWGASVSVPSPSLPHVPCAVRSLSRPVLPLPTPPCLLGRLCVRRCPFVPAPCASSAHAPFVLYLVPSCLCPHRLVCAAGRRLCGLPRFATGCAAAVRSEATKRRKEGISRP